MPACALAGVSDPTAVMLHANFWPARTLPGSTAKRLRRLLATGFGLSLLLGVVLIGWAPLQTGLTTAGWSLLWVIPLHLLADATDSLGWRSLLRGRRRRPGAVYFAWMASMRDAASSLLPIIGSAAPLLGASLLAARRIRGVVAFASVVVESSLSLISQALFVIVASTLGATVRGDQALLWLLWPPALVTLTLGALFLLLQRRREIYVYFVVLVSRSRFLSRYGRVLPLQLHAALRGIHRRPLAPLICVVWQLAALGIGALELWLMLTLLHHPVGLLIPLLLQAAVKLSRSLSFAIPAGLGVQEGVFAALASAGGLPVSVGLSLSLLSRCRDLLFGTPLLVAWWLYRSTRASRGDAVIAWPPVAQGEH